MNTENLSTIDLHIISMLGLKVNLYDVEGKFLFCGKLSTPRPDEGGILKNGNAPAPRTLKYFHLTGEWDGESVPQWTLNWEEIIWASYTDREIHVGW